MTGQFTVAKTLAVVLLFTLAVFCLGDLAQAFMPGDEHADCVTRLCDGQTGCLGAAPAPLTLPPATLALIDNAVGGGTPVIVPQRGESPGAPTGPIVPLTPRSPPAA